jgi:hypothetical protein
MKIKNGSRANQENQWFSRNVALCFVSREKYYFKVVYLWLVPEVQSLIARRERIWQD